MSSPCLRFPWCLMRTKLLILSGIPCMWWAISISLCFQDSLCLLSVYNVSRYGSLECLLLKICRASYISRLVCFLRFWMLSNITSSDIISALFGLSSGGVPRSLRVFTFHDDSLFLFPILDNFIWYMFNFIDSFICFIRSVEPTHMNFSFSYIFQLWNFYFFLEFLSLLFDETLFSYFPLNI